MNTVLIINSVAILFENFLANLSMAITTTLFLNCRWSRRKSITVLLVFAFIPVSLLSIATTTVFKMICTSAFSFVSLCLVTKDRFWKKLLAFFIFYTVFVFSESLVIFLANKIRPNFGPEELMRMNQLRMVEKIMEYDYYRASFVPLVLAATLLFAHLIYLIFNKEFLELKGSFFHPFAFLGAVQLSFVVFTTYFINAFVRGAYVYVVLMLIQILMLANLLWLVWQMSVTVKRLRVEKELELFHHKEELSLTLYREIHKELLESGSFRHDFQNQMQIIDCLLERGGKESLQRAEVMLKELNRKLEFLKEPDKMDQNFVPVISPTSSSV